MPCMAESSRATIKYALAFWDRQLGNMVASEVRPEYISEIKTKLRKQEISGYTVSKPASINRIVAALSCVYNHAVDVWKYVSFNPVKQVKKEKVIRESDRILTKDEIKKVLDAARQDSNPYIYLTIKLAITTGMRYRELFNLRWQDINLETGQVTIPKTKNNSPRSLYLDNKCLEEVKYFKQSAKDNDRMFPPICGSENLYRIDTVWKRIRKRSGVKARWHDLRHTAVSIYIMAGTDIRTVQDIVGHKNLATTQRYAHLYESHKKEAMLRAMSGMLENL